MFSVITLVSVSNSKLPDYHQENQKAQRTPSKYDQGDDQGDMNLDGSFAYQDTCMPPFLTPGHKEAICAESKLPDHYQEDQELQGHQGDYQGHMNQLNI